MEVHHPHHPTHKKKWSEYLLEFFMLFLAVFLGFIAENIREHLLDKEKTEQYMRTMVENLKYDTTRCNSNIRRNMETTNGLDSFRHELTNAIDKHVDGKKLYYFYLKYGRGSSHAVLTTTALQQMRSSGTFRLVKDDKLVEEIIDYYDRIATSPELAFTNMIKAREELTQSYKAVFNWQYFDYLLQREQTVGSQTDTTVQRYLSNLLNNDTTYQLLNTDSKVLVKLYNDLAQVEIVLRQYDAYLQWTKNAADSLIQHIKAAYHFSEE